MNTETRARLGFNDLDDPVTNRAASVGLLMTQITLLTKKYFVFYLEVHYFDPHCGWMHTYLSTI